MKMARGSIENNWLISNEAIFMQSGEPEDHEICVRNDKERVPGYTVTE
jgi:hypothetical protein